MENDDLLRPTGHRAGQSFMGLWEFHLYDGMDADPRTLMYAVAEIEENEAAGLCGVPQGTVRMRQVVDYRHCCEQNKIKRGNDWWKDAHAEKHWQRNSEKELTFE